MGEKEIVKTLKKRQEAGLEAVIDLYGGLIKSITARHLSGYERYIDECMNDILLSIWDNIRQFDPKKNTFKNWICAISKYKSIDYKRKYYRESQWEEVDGSLPDRDNVEQQVLEQELNEEIESLLNCLKPEDRTLFFDHYILDKNIADLSEAMHVKPEVLYNRLSRGKKKIRKHVSS